MEGLSYIDYLINIVLAAIMFGLGLSLTFRNFRDIFRYPKAFFTGLVSQMVIMPLIGFVIAILSGLPPEFKVGIMILSTCPGGTTSGFVTYLFKGNVALSIAMTSLNSILTVFTIPVLVNFSLEFFMHQHADLYLPFFDTVFQIFLLILLPALLGILIRQFKPEIADKMQKPVKYLMIILLAFVYTIKFFAAKEHGGTGISFDETWVLLPALIAFNVLCFAFSIIAGYVVKLNIRDAYTIAIEVSLHNTTLALLIGGTLLKNQDMIKPALIYSMFSFWTALVFVQLIKWIYRKKI